MTAPLGRLARKAARWLRRPFASGAVILVYHRISEIPDDPQLLSVAPERFASHLEVVRAAGVPVRLLDLTRATDGGAIPSRAVALTFDDGYADNLHAAKRLLERLGMPATVFVTTGWIGSPREFWWDELDRLLLRADTLPDVLALEIGGATRRWELREAGRGGARAAGTRAPATRAWSVAERSDPGPRERAYRELCAALRDLRAAEREPLLDRLAAWAGADRKARGTRRALSADEVRRLAEGGLIEVAPHTVTHPVLSKLPVEDQRREIEESARTLEALLGRRAESFAYPFGDRGSYDAGTVSLVREAAFACACANEPDTVRRGTDRYRLPRFIVRDWSREEFARRLERWLRGG